MHVRRGFLVRLESFHLTLLSTRVLILEFGQVVDVLVHDDPEVVRFVVRRDVAGRECFGHVGEYCGCEEKRKGYRQRCGRTGEERRNTRRRGRLLLIPGITLAGSGHALLARLLW